MDYNDKNKRYFMCNTGWDNKCKRESCVSAECCVIIDNDNCESLYSEFDECIKKDRTDDIVEIVHNIRKIINGYEEIMLKVQIDKEGYNQKVEYFDGVLYNCSFTRKNWDDIVSVSRNYRGTDIRYKKSGKLISNEAYAEIGAFLSKVDELENCKCIKNIKSKKKVR